mgnify:CR=1 FL=1
MKNSKNFILEGGRVIDPENGIDKIMDIGIDSGIFCEPEKVTNPQRVNVSGLIIAPGFIDTEMTRILEESVRAKLVEQIPLARLGQPEDVARCVSFLVSEKANYITGQVINVNGGMLM